MAKTQFPRMQHLSREILCQARRINFIAQHRMTEMVKMHTNLMRASAMQSAFDQARLVPCANDAVFSFSCATTWRSDAHALSMCRVSPDFFFDYACLFAQLPGDEREINLLDYALGKLSRQFSMRRIIFRDDKTAAGVFVETMHDAGPFFSTDAGQHGAMAEQCVDQSVLAMTGTGMNDEPGRFVDDDEIVVFEENVERNRFRPGVDLFRRRFGDFDLITGSQKLPWPSSGAVEADEADAD